MSGIVGSAGSKSGVIRKGTSDWVTMPSSWFGLGWNAYDLSATAWMPTYRIDNGILFMRGFLKDGSASTILNIGAGFRPKAHTHWAGSAANAFAGNTTDTDGLVSASAISSTWVTITHWFYIK